MSSLNQFAAYAATLIKAHFEGWAQVNSKNGVAPAWVVETLTLVSAITSDWVIGVLVAVRGATRDNDWAPAQLVIGATIPGNIRGLQSSQLPTRMKLFAEVALSAMCQCGWLIASATANEYKGKTSGYSATHGLGFKLGRLTVSKWDKSGISMDEISVDRLMVEPGAQPKSTTRVLGTPWARDGMELDHCWETVELSNSVPLTWNKDVLHEMGDRFEMGEVSKEDWNPTVYPKFEDYCAYRQQQFDCYVSKIPETIAENQEEQVYNTYAPDSRGRLYPCNDTYNYVGIKQVRALLSLAKGEVISLEESGLLKDYK